MRLLERLTIWVQLALSAQPSICTRPLLAAVGEAEKNARAPRAPPWKMIPYQQHEFYVSSKDSRHQGGGRFPAIKGSRDLTTKVPVTTEDALSGRQETIL